MMSTSSRGLNSKRVVVDVDTQGDDLSTTIFENPHFSFFFVLFHANVNCFLKPDDDYFFFIFGVSEHTSCSRKRTCSNRTLEWFDHPLIQQTGKESNRIG